MDSNDLSPLAGGTLPDPKGRSYLLDTNVLLHDAACLDASSNGLTYVVERFKDQQLYGHITLAKSERSQLASLAVKLL